MALPPSLSPWPVARSPIEVGDLFFRQRQVDRIGVNLHAALAVVACLGVGFPTTVVEWAGLGALVVFLVRMTEHHRMLRPLWLDPVIWLLGGWMAVVGASIAWTAGSAKEWLGEAQSLRFALFLFVLFPVLEYRRWMIGAVLVSIAVGQAVQLGHAMGWTSIQRLPGRVSGWWDPVVGGSLLCGALGMHLGGALLGRSVRARALGVVGALASLLGVIATGSRGAWIGAALTVMVAGLVATFRLPGRSRGLALAGLCGLVLVGGGMAWMVPPVRERLDRGVAEVRAAIQDNRFTTDTGLRIAMAHWALAEVRAKPLLGVGAGGYKAWAAAQTPERARELGAPPRARTMLHAHAHSWTLHVLATNGLVGFLLLAGGVAVAVWSGLAGPRDGAQPWGYDAAPALGIVGLAGAGLFDTITVNQQTAYLLFILIALCLPMRPRAFGEPGARLGGSR